jgi:5-methylcytosine-specific restriction endonuclease McrA
LTIRKVAKEQGLKIYHTNPCKKCGDTSRYVSSFGCVSCAVETGLKKLQDDDLMRPYRTKEKANKRLRRWRENNPDKFQQQWLSEPKHQKNARAAKRRGAIRNQTPANTDFQVINEVYKQAEMMTKNSGIPYEVDHITPICKGGLHHQDNLQIITKEANRKKGGK